MAKIDPRILKLADIVVNYSISTKLDNSRSVRKGDAIQVVGDLLAKDLILEIFRIAIKKGLYPMVKVSLPGMNKIYFENASEEQLKNFPEIAMYTAKKTRGYVSIHAPKDKKELAKISPKRIAMRDKVTRTLTSYIVNERDKMRRVSLNFPTKALAKDAGMSLKEYENFLFNATNVDWKKAKKKMLKIRKFFEKGSEVRIIGKKTDITLGIKNRKFVIDAGEENMPGGEMFCAPLETKTNGHILFTYPSERDGRKIAGIYLEFKNGKVIKARAKKNNDYLQEILKLKGAKIVGELGIGCNESIKKFTNELLFDEKIGGTIHLALGMSYKECNGKNGDAEIHWDIVKDLKKDGMIYVDNKLIQKNGKWLF